MQIRKKSKSQRAGQDCEGDNWNQPAEKGDDEAKTYVVCLNLLHFSYLTIKINPRAAIPTTTIDQPTMSHLKNSDKRAP